MPEEGKPALATWNRLKNNLGLLIKLVNKPKLFYK